MGSSASKAGRKLPTASTTIRQHPPPLTGARTSYPDPTVSESTSLPPPFPKDEPSGEVLSRKETGLGGNGGTFGQRGPTQKFTGEKDETIRRDAQDPQFMSNLSKLGQVRIHDAGRFVPNPVAAQRTLNSRFDEFTNPNLTPPPGHLTAPLLSSLLDQLKTLPPGSDPTKVYAEYGMTKERVEGLRRWVNSPSITGDDEVVVVEGVKIVEMKAVWVDSATPSQPKQVPAP